VTFLGQPSGLRHDLGAIAQRDEQRRIAVAAMRVKVRSMVSVTRRPAGWRRAGRGRADRSRPA
jgi:hypothetical protein